MSTREKSILTHASYRAKIRHFKFFYDSLYENLKKKTLFYYDFIDLLNKYIYDNHLDNYITINDIQNNIIIKSYKFKISEKINLLKLLDLEEEKIEIIDELIKGKPYCFKLK